MDSESAVIKLLHNKKGPNLKDGEYDGTDNFVSSIEIISAVNGWFIRVELEDSYHTEVFINNKEGSVDAINSIIEYMGLSQEIKLKE